MLSDQPNADMNRVQDFVRLTAERKELEQQLAAVKAKLDALQEPLQAFFERSGMQNTRVNDMTVYLSRSLRGSPDGNKEDLVAALEADPTTAPLVNKGYAWQQLDALIREWPEDEATGLPVIPEHLRGKLKVYEQLKIAARK